MPTFAHFPKFYGKFIKDRVVDLYLVKILIYLTSNSLGGNLMQRKVKNQLSKFSGKAEQIRIKTNGVIKKTIVATLIISTITINTAFAETKTEPKLQTIYHVYINDEFLGTVTDKSKVEDLVNNKLNTVKEQYKNFDLSYKTDNVVFVPEQIFRATNIEESEVIQTIDQQLEVLVDAVALKIDGEVVTYLENQDKLDEVIDKLLLKYVSKEELEKVEKLKASKDPLPELKSGESRILDVYLSKNVTASIDEVKPSQVLSVNDALKLLQKGTLKEEKYTIKEGDVLGSIAEKHGLKLKQLLELNPGVTEDTVLQIGDQLNVTVYKPFLDVVVKRETNKKEEIKYTTKTVENSSMYKGDTKVVQNGKNGEKSVTYVTNEVNGKTTKKDVVSEVIVKKPVEKIVHKGTKVVPSRGTGNFAWPTNGGYISSKMGWRWGKMHKGIDIARPSNYTIKAADNGKVVFAGWDSGGYGNKIIIDHGNGYRTVYAHLKSISVSVGQTVPKGSKIGIMGSTGYSTGIHLHFEIYKNGQLQNPLNYLR